MKCRPLPATTVDLARLAATKLVHAHAQSNNQLFFNLMIMHIYDQQLERIGLRSWRAIAIAIDIDIGAIDIDIVRVYVRLRVDVVMITSIRT